VLGVEAGHVGGRGQRERLELALTDTDPARPLNRLSGLFERPARRLDRGQAPQPMGIMLARGQVQHRIRRVEVGHTSCAVGDPGHPDPPEHGGQLAMVTLLHPSAHHAINAGDTLDPPLLTSGPQIQVVLRQAAHQLPGTLGEQILQLRMRQLSATRTSRLRHDFLEQPTGPVKPLDHCFRQP